MATRAGMAGDRRPRPRQRREDDGHVNGSGIGHLEQALAIRHEIGDRMGEAQAANNLADAYEHLGRMDETIGLLRRALDLNPDVGDRYGEGVALSNLGAALLGVNRAEDGIGSLQQARRAFARSATPMVRGTPCTSSGSAMYPWDRTPKPWNACGSRLKATRPRVIGTGRRSP